MTQNKNHKHNTLRHEQSMCILFREEISAFVAILACYFMGALSCVVHNLH